MGLGRTSKENNAANRRASALAGSRLNDPGANRECYLAAARLGAWCGAGPAAWDGPKTRRTDIQSPRCIAQSVVAVGPGTVVAN